MSLMKKLTAVRSMREWMTAREIAASDLPGLPASKWGINKKAKNEGWASRPRKGCGGGLEYATECLPQEARSVLQDRALIASHTLPALAPSKDALPEGLTGDQVKVAKARAVIVQHVQDMALDYGLTRAIKILSGQSKNGALPDQINRMIPTANAKSGAKTTTSRAFIVSERTVFRWVSAYDKQGLSGLVPNLERKTLRIPEWGQAFVDLYARPSKPALIAVVEALPDHLPEGVQPPSYDQAYRFLQKLTPAQRNRGRMGQQELKALQAFVRRDTSDLFPGAVFSADGHCFKATVEHPFHGQPFRPEVTAVIDVHTRYVVGWSVGLSENSIDVLEAISNAVLDRDDGRKHGVPAIFYSDNGAGFNNQLLSEAGLGFFARWGITQKNSLPYASQARGIIERLNRSLFIPAAKELDTYLGRDSDKTAARMINKKRRIAKSKGARFEITWDEFVEGIERAIDAYNGRPHSSLPRRRCNETLTHIHYSPVELWEAWEAEHGKVPAVPMGAADDLLRPTQKRRVARCEIQLMNNRYFSHDLEAWHGKDVLVAYDIQDASRIWVREMETETLICVAERDANSRAYFDSETMMTAVSVREQQLAKRAKGRLKRLDQKRAEVIAEAQGPALEGDARTVMDMPTVAAPERVQVEADAQPMAQPETQGARPLFSSDREWIVWLMNNPDQITDQDVTTLRRKLHDPSFQLTIEMEEIDPRHLLERAA